MNEVQDIHIVSSLLTLSEDSGSQWLLLFSLQIYLEVSLISQIGNH